MSYDKGGLRLVARLSFRGCLDSNEKSILIIAGFSSGDIVDSNESGGDRADTVYTNAGNS
jgi:hypothetical protein